MLDNCSIHTCVAVCYSIHLYSRSVGVGQLQYVHCVTGRYLRQGLRTVPRSATVVPVTPLWAARTPTLPALHHPSSGRQGMQSAADFVFQCSVTVLPGLFFFDRVNCLCCLLVSPLHGWEIAVILRNFRKTKFSKSKFHFFFHFFFKLYFNIHTVCNSTTFALRHTQISLSGILRHFRPPSRHLLLNTHDTNMEFLIFLFFSKTKIFHSHPCL